MIMYVGLFGHSAVLSFAFLCFFMFFYVLLTVCVVLFFSVPFYSSIQLYSCQSV